jgi:hypothetical protein
MYNAVAVAAERDQVRLRVISGMTAEFFVVNLEAATRVRRRNGKYYDAEGSSQCARSHATIILEMDLSSASFQSEYRVPDDGSVNANVYSIRSNA